MPEAGQPCQRIVWKHSINGVLQRDKCYVNAANGDQPDRSARRKFSLRTTMALIDNAAITNGMLHGGGMREAATVQERQLAFLIIARGLPVFRPIRTNQATPAKLLVPFATDGPHHYEGVAVVRIASSCHSRVVGKRDSISRSMLIRSYLTLNAV